MATHIDTFDDIEQRRVSIPLAIGILFIPYIFSWLVLRKGYSLLARIVALGWLVFCVIAFVIPRMANQPASNAPGSSSPQQVATKPAEASAPNAPSAVPPADASTNWTYQTSDDAMRGTTTKYAATEALNEIHLDFPYGDQTPELMLRKRPQDGLNVMLRTDAQVLCNSFTDSYVSVKFDKGPIARYSCTSASDGDSSTAFIENERKFVANLKKAKTVMIEAEFYQAGRQQMTFNVAGLNW